MKTQTSSDYLLSTSREYAIYVCDSRGIPSVIDGLKHVQRIALYVLSGRSEKLKTYALTGLLGYQKLNVHGESSCNDAIGLLAAPYKNNVCLIEGLGQFGNRIAPDDEGIGAPRYTEVRRSKAAEAFLYQDLDIIPMEDNYDGSTRQPIHFLPLIPTVLLNGVNGIAVGWSTEILRRNLKDLIAATKAALNGEKIERLIPYYEKYDIKVTPTDKPNQWEYTGKAEIIDSSTVRVTELPPGMSIESFRKTLIELENQDLIANFEDRSNESIYITIKMPRGSIKDWTEKTAIDFFKIKEKTTERIVTIDWDRQKVLTYNRAEELVVDFAKWRLAWYTKRYQKYLKDDSYELNYWYALKILFDLKFPTKLGGFSNKKEVEEAIKLIVDGNSIILESEQLDKIVNLPTYKWAVDFYIEITKKIADLEKKIISHKDILSSADKLKQIYISELDALKNFK